MKKENKLKIILIVVLCIVTTVLIYFYFSNNKKSNEPENVASLNTGVSVTPERINIQTDSVLNLFGIKNEWIKEINSNDKDLKKIQGQNKDLILVKEVSIPRDLPVIELNLAITNYLNSRNYNVKVNEDARSGNLFFEIFNAEDTSQKPAGLIKFTQNNSINRNTSTVCLVIDSLDALSLKEAEEILNSPREFSVFMPLRNDKAEYQSLITEQKTDNLIKFFTGNENDIMADFRDDMKESQWKQKVRAAAIGFANSGGIILYNSGSTKDFYDKVKEEFLNNNVNIYEDNIFTDFRPGEDKINSLFANIVAENSKGKENIFYKIYLTIDEFKDYEKKVSELKQSGYKFHNFSETIKNEKKVN